MPSPRAAARFKRTRGVPIAAMSVGSTPGLPPSASRGRRPTSTRIACRTGTADDADAAEMVMRRRPTSDAEPSSFELLERNLVHARFRVDDVGGCMKPRAPHRGSGGKAFVEDARDDREERGPEP